MGTYRPAAMQLKVYPNPVSDHVFIETSSAGSSYRLLDISGRIISEGTLNGSKSLLDVGGLSPGICFLWIDAGGITECKKIVIK
jgi:hypothetical protein